MSAATVRGAAPARCLALAVALACLAPAAGLAAGDEPAPKSAFWTEREEAYRNSPRGPFTAIFADYVERGDSVVLIAGPDGVRTVDAAPEPAVHDTPALRITLGDDGFTVSGLDGWAPGTLGGKDLRAATSLGDGAEDGKDLRLGRYLISLGLQTVELGRVLAYDPRLLQGFHGFPAFEENEAYRVTARVVPADGEVVQLGTTRGLEKPYVRAALLEFEVEGTPCRLTAFRAEGEDDGVLFVPFRDATSGGATYGVGRYLEVDPRPDGTATLDFNHATNPWCAYSPFYNCVMPPEENLLPVAIRAGELAPEGH